MTLELYRASHSAGAYCYGLDSSKGTGSGDYSVLSIWDASMVPVEEVACLRSRTANGQDLAYYASVLHRVYPVYKGSRHAQRGGGLVPETNLDELRTELERYFSLDYWYVQEGVATPRNQAPTPKKYGFYTTRPAKTALISRLHAAISTRAIIWHNPWLADECRYWSRHEGHWEFLLESGQSSMGHGDTTMAVALALAGVEAVSEQVTRLQERARTPAVPNRVYADWSEGPPRVETFEEANERIRQIMKEAV